VNESLLYGIQDKARGEESVKRVNELLAEYQEDFAALNALELSKAEETVLSDIDKPIKAFAPVFAEITDKFHEIEEYKEKLDALGAKASKSIEEALHRHQDEPAQMEAEGADMGAIAIQTEMVKLLSECEIAELRLSHEEVEFLGDKRIERVAHMEHELGILYGTLEAVKTLVPQAATSKTEEAQDLAMVAQVHEEMKEFQRELACVIEDELVVEVDVLKTTELLQTVEAATELMASNAKHHMETAKTQANTLATEARQAANGGTEAMSRMSAAIADIQKSSDETAKIIKVIDEIAFQTNLLALNAAVEAARAGEAGKGFAVVAEEVRNLAMRSAEAAKNTAAMIEGSVKNSQNGVDIAGEVSKVLDEIVTSVGKTTDLVGEIAAASQEQAQGIDQVNTAVSQMDKVTQQNAASAEESASASEELSAQAESMSHAVQELVGLVGGRTDSRAGQMGRTTGLSRATAQRPAQVSHDAYHQIAQAVPERHQGVQVKTPAQQEIPLHDDKGMSDFNH